MTAVEKAIYIPVMWLAISLACGWVGYKLGTKEHTKPQETKSSYPSHIRVLPPRVLPPRFYDQDLDK